MLRRLALHERQKVPPEVEAPPAPVGDGEATWDDLQPVDLLGLELGYRLISLVDKSRQGDLLTRIKGVRRKFAQEVGFLPPAVHVRDNLELKPSGYRITLRGVVVGEGEAFPGMFLAINPGGITTPLIGTPTTDPAFGLPAHWIDDKQKEAAQMAGFTVVDSETVMATHLSHLMQVQAAKLAESHGNPATGGTRGQAGPQAHRRSGPQNGLHRNVPESPAAAAGRVCAHPRYPHHHRDAGRARRCAITTRSSWPAACALRCRPPSSSRSTAPRANSTSLPSSPGLERLLVQALGNTAGPALDPGVADILTQKAAEVALKQEEMGLPACLLVPDQIRNAISRLVRRVAPRLQVLAHSEIPETHTIRIGPILKGASA